MRIGEVAAVLVVGAASLTAVGTGAIAQVTPGFVAVVDDTRSDHDPGPGHLVRRRHRARHHRRRCRRCRRSRRPPTSSSSRDTWSMSGVSYEAYPPGPAVADVMAAADLSRACAAGAPPVAYSGGGFTGQRGRWSQCGGGTAGVDMIVASPSDQSLLVVLLVVTTAPAEAAIVETIIGSMNVVPAPTGQPLPTAVPVPGRCRSRRRPSRPPPRPRRRVRSPSPTCGPDADVRPRADGSRAHGPAHPGSRADADLTAWPVHRWRPHSRRSRRSGTTSTRRSTSPRRTASRWCR